MTTLDVINANVGVCAVCPLSRFTTDRGYPATVCAHDNELVGQHAETGCPEKKFEPAPLPAIPARDVVIRGNQGAGDLILLTGAVRDLHLSHPGRFRTVIRTDRVGLLAHNPLASMKLAPGAREFTVGVWPWQYPKVEGHFAGAWRKALGGALGVEVPLIHPAGDVYVSAAERVAPPPVVPRDRPYWLAWFNGKHDFSVKWLPRSYYQGIVDGMAARGIAVVSVGNGSYAPDVNGVIDLRHKTNDFRQLVRLMFHAEGAMGPVSFGMHLAAAVPVPPGKPDPRPFVTFGGGGETPAFYTYPGHVAVNAIGTLDCCQTAGCWKFKAEFRGTDCRSSDCRYPLPVVQKHQQHPDTLFARCMLEACAPDRVLAAVDASREWDPSMPSRGVGDVVRKFTEATGIHAKWTAILGRECATCGKVQKALNRVASFK